MIINIYKEPPYNVWQMRYEIAQLSNFPMKDLIEVYEHDGRMIVYYPFEVSEEVYHIAEQMIANHTPNQAIINELQELSTLKNQLLTTYNNMNPNTISLVALATIVKSLLRFLILFIKYVILTMTGLSL